MSSFARGVQVFALRIFSYHWCCQLYLVLPRSWPALIRQRSSRCGNILQCFHVSIGNQMHGLRLNTILENKEKHDLIPKLLPVEDVFL